MSAAATERLTTAERRRQHRRLDLEVEVTMTSDTNFFMGFTENLSEGGIFVATYDYAPMGSIVEFDFRLPEGREPMHVKGIVMWLREYNPMVPDMMPGMGLQFRDLTPAQETTIQGFLDSRDPLFIDTDL
jgi:uncharacterized protein (TIGR02266 family)